MPWSIQNPVALVFDEYDAGRPDVMFVIQRILEAEGNFTLLDKNKVIKQINISDFLLPLILLDWEILQVFTMAPNK